MINDSIQITQDSKKKNKKATKESRTSKGPGAIAGLLSDLEMTSRTTALDGIEALWSLEARLAVYFHTRYKTFHTFNFVQYISRSATPPDPLMMTSIARNAYIVCKPLHRIQLHQR